MVGTGPGAAEWLTPAAWRAIRGAEVVVGGRRQLERFAPAGAERVVVGGDMDEVAAALRAHAGRRVVVLASGDPGFFGIPVALRRLLPEAEIVTLPGISSVQLAAARLGRPWHDLPFASAHGRTSTASSPPCASTRACWRSPTRAHTPQALAAALVAAGIARRRHRARAARRAGRDASPPATRPRSPPATFDGLRSCLIEREEPA